MLVLECVIDGLFFECLVVLGGVVAWKWVFWEFGKSGFFLWEHFLVRVWSDLGIDLLQVNFVDLLKLELSLFAFFEQNFSAFCWNVIKIKYGCFDNCDSVMWKWNARFSISVRIIVSIFLFPFWSKCPVSVLYLFLFLFLVSFPLLENLLEFGIGWFNRVFRLFPF